MKLIKFYNSEMYLLKKHNLKVKKSKLEVAGKYENLGENLYVSF